MSTPRLAVLAGARSPVSAQIARTLADQDVTVVVAGPDPRTEQTRITAEHGRVTDLVWVGPTGVDAALATMTRTDWDSAVRENVSAAFAVAQAFVPSMAAAGTGAVVFVTGQQARRGVARQAHVAAATWAIIGMAKTVALEVAANGVQVATVCAGPLEGSVVPNLPQPRPFVEPGEVADAVAFLLSDRARSWTGSVVDVSLGQAARNTA